ACGRADAGTRQSRDHTDLLRCCADTLYFARKEWAQQNRDVVKKFSDVLTASAAYTNAHHAELTATIADLESVSASAIERMTWPTGGTSLNVREMQPVIDIAFRHGLIPKRFDAREM